jgi:drug/metabolite transporter (DMT)-like permease
MTSQKAYRRRNGSYALAIVLLVLAGVAMVVARHNFMIRSLASAAVVASVYLVQKSRRASLLPPSYVPIDQSDDSDEGKGLERIMRFVGVALLGLLVFCYYLMEIDAAHGGHEVWPVNLFAGVAITFAGVWGYLASRRF